MAVANHGPPQKRGAIVPREKKVGGGGNVNLESRTRSVGKFLEIFLMMSLRSFETAASTNVSQSLIFEKRFKIYESTRNHS